MPSVPVRALVLWVVGTLTAIAALFAPADRWFGVDLGATGATLFVLTLGCAICLFATRANEVFPEELSVGERGTWVSLVFLTLIVLTFLHHFGTLSPHGSGDIRDALPNAFTRQLMVLVIGWWWITHLIARAADGVERDERDLRLQDRADRVSDLAFTLTIIAGIVLLVAVPEKILEWWLAPVILANLLIGVLIIRSLLEHVALAVAYRAARG